MAADAADLPKAAPGSPGRMARKFTFRSLYSWYWPTNIAKSEAAESRLLAFGGIETQPQGSTALKTGQLWNVDIGDGKYIHTLSLSPLSDNAAAAPCTASNVVLCHGYAAGLGFYYKNLHALSRNLSPKYRIYAIDWLGMGRSARPPFPKHQASDPESSCQQATDFFVSSLEAWRQQVPSGGLKPGLDKFTLVGHSMGGYLAMQYALRYPQHVERLVLLSPVGVPAPPATRPSTPESRAADLPMADDAIALGARPGRSAALSPSSSLPSSKASTGGNASKELPVAVTGRRIPGWINTLWNRNFTPQWIVRSLGPIGPRLVKRYTDFRFQYLPEQELSELKEYLYHITADAPSGEYAMASLLQPGAWARAPLWPQFKDLKVQTTFIYGDSDWMDYRHAESSLPLFRVPAKVLRVPYAGHHLYLDNPASFNELLAHEILGQLDSVQSSEASLRIYRQYKEKSETEGCQDRPSYLY